MNLTLHHIPNLNYFFKIVNECTGLVFLELKDQSYLNLKNNGEGKFFLESAGNRLNGLRVVTEKVNDAVLLSNALLVSR